MSNLVQKSEQIPQSLEVLSALGDFKSDLFISLTSSTPIKFPNTDLIEHECLHCSHVASVINTSGYVHTLQAFTFFLLTLFFISDYTAVW